MKTIIALCSAVLMLMVFSIQSFSQDKDENNVAFTEVTINVPTVKCGNCVKTVTSALLELEGVKEIKVDKKAKTAVVKYDASKLKVADLETAITKSGYDANEVKRDKKAYENLDSCCK